MLAFQCFSSLILKSYFCAIILKFALVYTYASFSYVLTHTQVNSNFSRKFLLPNSNSSELNQGTLVRLPQKFAVQNTEISDITTCAISGGANTYGQASSSSVVCSPSVHTFKRLLLWNHEVSRKKIICSSQGIG